MIDGGTAHHFKASALPPLLPFQPLAFSLFNP
jgi:hypothetical protein